MINEYNFSAVDFDPFEHGEIEKTIIPIESQEEIWAACMIGGTDANRAYNESVSLLFTGILQKSVMEIALQEVVNRHEALRATISADGKYLCVNKFSALNVLFEDLSSKSGSNQEKYLQDFGKNDSEKSFDLQNGPLIRAALFKLSEKNHLLRLTIHHIICDGWSLGIILQDLSIFYTAHIKNEVPLLPPAISFTQYADEMQEFSKSETYEKTEQYWLNEYKGEIPVLDLPTDFPRPARKTYKSMRDDFVLDSELVIAIKQLSTKAGVSFVSTLMVAFELYLHKLTGQKDIVLGLPSAGQSVMGHHSLVGHCVNLLPLRSLPNTDLTFLSYLKLRRTKILDDFENQQFTFGTLLKKLRIRRDGSRIPLVPVVFNVDMGMDNDVSFYNLNHKLISNPRAYENFEISLNVTGSVDSMILEWSYNTQLFKQETIKRRMTEFEELLKKITLHPEAKIKTLFEKDINYSKQFVEVKTLVNEIDSWSNNLFPYDKQKTVCNLITEAAVRFPENVAVSFQDTKISYKTLEENSNRLANLFIDKGVKTGDKIGVAIDRSADMIVILLAIMKAGSVYLPFDTNHPKERIGYMLEDADAAFLIASKKCANQYPESIPKIYLESILSEMGQYEPKLNKVDVTGNDLIYILYTSGSTGKPKGVQIRHSNVVNFLLGMQRTPGIKKEDKLLAITPISFDMAVLLYLPLVCGAELVIADIESSKDGRLIYDIIEKKQISWMIATPSTWRMIIDAGWNKKLQLLAISAGESLSKDLASNLLNRCTSLWNGYGPTETAVMVLMKEIINVYEPITIGKPIINTQIYILDGDTNKVPIDTIGEIYIAGDSVGAGYKNLPELTAAHFIKNPFSSDTESKMYKTGDLGRLTINGDIEYLGRIDHQVKIRGHRIELGEIEQTLITHEDIKSAVVNPVGNSPENLLLVAYVIINKEFNKISPNYRSNWEEHLKKTLPGYMIPYECIIVDSFPLTENGKIDRKALPAPTRIDHQHAKQEYIAPRNITEDNLSRIWATALELDLEQISVTSDFFELGGHSLIAVKIMVTIEKQTKRRLPLSTLFENPTIEKLARMITIDEKEISWNALVKIKPWGSKVPIYMIHGGGLNVLTFNSLAKYMDDDQPIYGIQALGLNGKSKLYYTMEEIASKYISEILNNNPNGPYVIAGYSLGGLIAYEIARQLKEMGKQIAMLGILDTNISDLNPYKSRVTKIFVKILRQFKKALFFSRHFIKNPKKTIEYQTKTLAYKIKNLFRIKYQVEDEYFTYEDEINRSYEIAFYNYKLKPLDVEINLFRVQERMYFLDDPIYLGWNKYALKGVKIHDVPGDHKTFLFPPNDKKFAEILQNNLDKIQITNTL